MYGIYYSFATFGIIAWGSALKTHIAKLLNIHKKIIKVLMPTTNIEIKLPLGIRKKFVLESISYHYNSLQSDFLQSNQITRNKNISLPQMTKEIGKRSHEYLSTFYFNKLNYENKVISNKNYKKKLQCAVSQLDCKHFTFLE